MCVSSSFFISLFSFFRRARPSFILFFLGKCVKNIIDGGFLSGCLQVLLHHTVRRNLMHPVLCTHLFILFINGYSHFSRRFISIL